MKKVLLIFWIVSNVSSYISAAQNQINAHTTWDDLLKIFEAENQRFEQRCKQISEQHKVVCKEAEEKQGKDLNVIKHVLTQPGSVLDPDRQYLLLEPSRLAENAANKVMDSNRESITAINEAEKQHSQSNFELLQQWLALQKDKK